MNEIMLFSFSFSSSVIPSLTLAPFRAVVSVDSYIQFSHMTTIPFIADNISMAQMIINNNSATYREKVQAHT